VGWQLADLRYAKGDLKGDLEDLVAELEARIRQLEKEVLLGGGVTITTVSALRT